MWIDTNQNQVTIIPAREKKKSELTEQDVAQDAGYHDQENQFPNGDLQPNANVGI